MEQIKQRLASSGTSCPNKECQLYAKVDEANRIKFGKSKRGVQRYRCKGCTTTFSATRGTLSYRRHTPVKDILETLALLTEGVRISSLSRAKGFKGGYDLELATPSRPTLTSHTRGVGS